MPTPTSQEATAKRISDEAAHWCIRLNEADFSEQERHRLEQWLKSDPAHRRELDSMREIWTLSQDLPLEAPSLPAMAVSTPRGLSRARRYRRPLKAAAALAVVLPLAWLLGWELNLLPSGYQRFDSQGTLRTLTLADGSYVQLNLNSQMSFAHYKDRRSATLAKGEAYFEVVHDASHPFLVDAGKGQVRVTGTRFNVWKDQANVVVTLIQGSVQVVSDRNRPDLQVALSPGMQAHYAQGQALAQVAPAPLISALAWRDGKLILADITLSDALPQINRYLADPLHLGDKTTGQLRIGGIYDTQNIGSLVDDLPKVLPVYLSHNDRGERVIRSKRASRP